MLHEWIGRHARGLAGHRSGGEVPLQRREHVRRECPDRGGEQRHVHDRRLTGSLASVERAGDAEGELHRAVPVAEATALIDRSFERRRRQRGAEPAPGPVGSGVVGGLVGVGPAHAVAVAARVDDLGVDRADVVDVEPELRERRRQEVRDEHVRGLDQAQQQVAALGGRDVEADAALAAVVHLHRLVHSARREAEDALAHEAAVAVTGDGVLDLDHVGTPVGEQRAARGHEHELGELDDTDAFEDGHGRCGDGHGFPTARCFTCWNDRIPSTPRSRPMPLCL